MKIDWKHWHKKTGGLSYLILNDRYFRIAWSINEGGFPANVHFSWQRDGALGFYLYLMGARYTWTL